MSMTRRAVLPGRRSPSYGHGYGSATTKRCVIGVTSLRSRAGGALAVDAQLAGGSRERPARRARRDHDPERHHVRRGVEQIVAAADPDRLERRAQRAPATEQDRGTAPAERSPP